MRSGAGSAGESRDPALGALLGRIAGGDASALVQFYDATSRIVRGLVLKIVADPADADDVTLDVYAQAWRQAARYDAERGDAVAWLLTLAHSRALGRRRARPGARRQQAGHDDLVTEASSSLGERPLIARDALGRLSAEQREVIELAYFEGLTHAEIAERMGLPLATAKSRIRLGMAKLREALKFDSEGWST